MIILTHKPCFTIAAFISLLLSGCVTEDEISVEMTYQFQTVAPDTVINPTSDYIVVLGDIQEYTSSYDYLYYLTYSLDWIRCQNNYYGNIRCVLQDGDVTNSNEKWQWDMARDAFHHLNDSTMYVWCTGNHDYAWGGKTGVEITDRNSTLLNYYIKNPLLDKSIIASYRENDYKNIIIRNTIGGERIDIISLEFGSESAVIEWAAGHVSNNPEIRYILMTHEYMSNNGTLYKSGETFAAYQFYKISHSEPEYLWENLIQPNDNILCVVNGHNGFCKYLESENNAGRMVPQILFNLQYQVNGGDSMIQLWEFPKDSNTVNIKVYNTMTRTEINPTENRYSFTF